MDRLTRKDLKHDKFAEEVGQGVEFLAEHKGDVKKYGIVAAVVVLVACGVDVVVARDTPLVERSAPHVVARGVPAPVVLEAGGHSAARSPRPAPTKEQNESSLLIQKRRRQIVYTYSSILSDNFRSLCGPVRVLFVGNP